MTLYTHIPSTHIHFDIRMTLYTHISGTYKHTLWYQYTTIHTHTYQVNTNISITIHTHNMYTQTHITCTHRHTKHSDINMTIHAHIPGTHKYTNTQTQTCMRKTERRVTWRPPLRWCTSVTSESAAASPGSSQTRRAFTRPSRECNGTARVPRVLADTCVREEWVFEGVPDGGMACRVSGIFVEEL